MSGKFQIDVQQLRKLAHDALTVAPEAWAATRAGLRLAAQPVLADARSRAEAAGQTGDPISPRIASSMHIVQGVDSVSIVVGGEEAPEAAPIENRGRGFVRHPVFGRQDIPWTDKHSRPAFLQPAFDSRAPASIAAVERAVMAVLNRAFGR